MCIYYYLINVRIDIFMCVKVCVVRRIYVCIYDIYEYTLYMCTHVHQQLRSVIWPICLFGFDTYQLLSAEFVTLNTIRWRHWRGMHALDGARESIHTIVSTHFCFVSVHCLLFLFSSLVLPRLPYHTFLALYV